jgi:hypothetical protein
MHESHRPHGTHRHSDAAETTRYFSQVETSFIHRNQSLSSGSVIDTFSNTYMPNAVMRARKLEVTDTIIHPILSGAIFALGGMKQSVDISFIKPETNDGLRMQPNEKKNG